MGTFSEQCLLLGVDREFAAEVRAAGCGTCGGRLDTSDYLRKPRGGPPPELKEEYSYRFSLCCNVEGCRKRATPPSVRYLGRRVYLGAAVILVSATIHGVTDKRLAELRERVYPTLAKDTLLRWRAWWQETLPATPFWRAARARFDRPVDTAELPSSLLERFGKDEIDRLVAALKFLSPLTARPRSARAG
jgi:hypothetical protein